MISPIKLIPLCRRSVILSIRPYVSASELIFGEDPPVILTPENSKPVKSFQAYPIAKNIRGKFVTPYCKETKKTVWDLLRLLTTSKKKTLSLPNITNTLDLLKPVIVDRAKLRDTTAPHVTWLGHATCYFQTEGAYFLTDPLWGSRASPFSFIGPKRYSNMPIEIEDLKIDVVLLSHTHYDHLDMHSVKRIGNRAKW
ncbi:MBL fold metallo-hydrolase [archaeon]|nr:MAG: MBL fold metallo-hydrolase [archaeon]